MKRALLLTTLASLSMLAAQSVAQTSGIVRDQGPSRTIRTSAPKIESTLNVVPQINPVYSMNTYQPRVHRRINLPNGATNSLPVGQSGSQVLVNPARSFPGINATGWTPPDPDLGVGPNHVVAVVNSSIAFFRKDGVKQYEQGLGPVAGSAEGFFESLGITDFVFDPKAFFDPISNRFYVVALEVDFTNKLSKILVGVSDDADPNGTWFKYRIESKQTVNNVDYWLDYPGFGSNKDGVLITGNMFGFDTGMNGVQYILLRKNEINVGQPATAIYFSNPGAFTAQVMRTNDATLDRIYCMSLQSNSSLMAHSIANINTHATLTTGPVPVPPFINAMANAQSAGGRVLDSLGGRLMTAEYRNDRFVTGHTVATSFSDSTNMVRWYEIRMNNWPVSGTPQVAQTGNIRASQGVHLFMPAIAINNRNEIAALMTRSSGSIVADMVATARRVSDPAGSMGAPMVLATSQAPAYNGGFRWGDYFGLTVDPNDGQTFWGIGMVANSSGNWLTRIESFRVTQTTTNPLTAITRYEGSRHTGTLTDASASDNRYFAVDSTMINRTGQVGSAISTFRVPQTNIVSLQLRAEVRAVPGTTLGVYAINPVNNAVVYLGAQPMTSTDEVKTVNIPTPNQYINQTTREIKLMIRAINPSNLNNNPMPFTFHVDHLQVAVTF